jgi:hypothetical protein
MFSGKQKITTALVLLVIVSTLFIPLPAYADGGPVVYHDLWENLKEGQQIAVVTLLNDDRAKVDLFISILDKTGQSHEITFFVPIGVNTKDFYAVEEKMADFDNQLTDGLDEILRDSADRKKWAVYILFSGALLTNGAMITPLWAPVLMTGCAAAEQKAEATYETESSEISIYGIDDDTNIDALIATTGLPGSVTDTLTKLKGQQIAVVKLHTQPQSSVIVYTRGGYSEPGLHLSWNTGFVQTDSKPTYSYPLGTGGSWSKPIEMTRVYVVAPQGVDFDVEYPALGSDRSGFDWVDGARINEYTQIPSYAVDEALGNFGRVWRATYTQSNPTQDIKIIAKAQSGMSKFRAGVQDSAQWLSFLFAIIIGMLMWMLAWHYLMPRFAGDLSRQQSRLRWYFALIYPALNIMLIVFPGSILFLLFILGLSIPSLLVLFVIQGGAVIGLYALVHSGHLGVSRSKAILAFIWTSLIGSGAYLILAVLFAFLIDCI